MHGTAHKLKHRARLASLLAALAIVALPAVARAEVVSGHADESIQQAYGPLAANTSYSGAFDNTSYDDVDYLAFTVSRANQSFKFAVADTTNPCNDPDQAGCPVYATLMDSTDHQVGGDTSSAGTVVRSGDTETIDWTFAQPGTYYLLMESNGDEAPGSPSYTVSFTTAPSAPLVTSLTVPSHQRGNAVAARIVLGQPAARLAVRLFALLPRGAQRQVAAITRTQLAAGAHRLTIRLTQSWSAALKRQGRLSLLLKFAVTAASGQHASYTRRLTLTR